MFVQGHGQKSEQKHRTKNFAKLPNHLPLLNMVTGMIKWGKNENPKQSLGLPTEPQKLTPKKPLAKFPSLKNLHKGLNNQFYETLHMRCNVLNIKTNAKQVWLYLIHRTMWLGYTGTTMNLQIVLNTPKFPTKIPA